MSGSTAKSEPIGHIPGPYGKAIAVYSFPDKPGEYHHDAGGCMDLAGIHDPAQREACSRILAEEMRNGSVSFELFLKHGGRRITTTPIVRPAKPATLELPRDRKIMEVAENWQTLALDYADWATRADALLDVVDGSSKEARSWTMAAHDGFEVVHHFSLSILVTSAVEHLAETEINCLEQAAFYAMTTHDEWSSAGVEWLKPFRKTWFRDWATARPSWQALARGMRKVNRDLPAWIVQGTSP